MWFALCLTRCFGELRSPESPHRLDFSLTIKYRLSNRLVIINGTRYETCIGYILLSATEILVTTRQWWREAKWVRELPYSIYFGHPLATKTKNVGGRNSILTGKSRLLTSSRLVNSKSNENFATHTYNLLSVVTSRIW